MRRSMPSEEAIHTAFSELRMHFAAALMECCVSGGRRRTTKLLGSQICRVCGVISRSGI